jgi:hypothetical protein
MDPPPPFSVRHITSIVIQNQVIQKRGPVIDCLCATCVRLAFRRDFMHIFSLIFSNWLQKCDKIHNFMHYAQILLKLMP